MDLGPHAAFIWLCYGAVAVVVAALISFLAADGARLRRELADLDAAGSVPRTNGSPDETGQGK